MKLLDHQCGDMIDLLNDYLDGELSPSSCAELEEHLRHCPLCQALLESLRQTLHILHSFADSPPPLPPMLEDRLISQMLQQRHMKSHQ